MLHGYASKVLFVDLTTGKINEEEPPESLYRDFIGGNGLGIRVLYERIKPKVDPLGSGNIIGFVTGLLTATTTPGSSRYMVVTKSPLTGAWAEANGGGYLGPELKWAGYDGVFISGAAEKPVYLIISGGKVEIKDASHLWGRDTNETDDILQRELGKPQVRVACIGPAGEACSLISGIVNEKGRVAARSGVGAVMGSKKLKAIVVRGSKKTVSVAEPEKYRSAREAFAKAVKQSKFQQGLTAVGTGGGTSFLLSIGDCPTKNWNATGTESMPTANNLDSANMNKYKIANYGCYACPVRCGALLKVKEGSFTTKGEVHRPEYETLAALGALCLNDSLESVIRANEICNLYGMDTMAVGNVIAFAMECYERGLINKKDTDGLELNWGNPKAVVALAEKMGKREGFGAVLADGVEKAAQRIGKGAEKYAMHVHGHRIPYHDPRNNPCKGTIYIADAQPAGHMETEGTSLLEQGVALGPDPRLKYPGLKVYGDYDKKGQMYADGAAYYQLLTAGGLCALYTIAFTVPVVSLIAPVAGWDFGWEEGLKAGRRILTLRQVFDAREGISAEDFKLPARLMAPQKIGPAAGINVDFDTLKKGYFKAMGWDIKTGKPERQTLVDLGLHKLTKDLQ